MRPHLVPYLLTRDLLGAERQPNRKSCWLTNPTLHGILFLGLFSLTGPTLEVAAQIPLPLPQELAAKRAEQAKKHLVGHGLDSPSPGKSHFETVAWLPPDIDARLPPVSAGISCVLPDVLRQTSLHARELVATLERFTATEHIEHWRIDGKGRPSSPQSRTFSYLVIVKVIKPGWFSVEE